LYNYANISDPHVGGDLLCTAADRNDLVVMQELLKHGLNVDSPNWHGLRPIQVALAKNHIEIAKLLISYGAKTVDWNGCEGGLKEKEMHEMSSEFEEREVTSWQVKAMEPCCARVNIFKGHPILNKERYQGLETGRLIKLPSSLEELKRIAGMYEFFAYI